MLLAYWGPAFGSGLAAPSTDAGALSEFINQSSQLRGLLTYVARLPQPDTP